MMSIQFGGMRMAGMVPMATRFRGGEKDENLTEEQQQFRDHINALDEAGDHEQALQELLDKQAEINEQNNQRN